MTNSKTSIIDSTKDFSHNYQFITKTKHLHDPDKNRLNTLFLARVRATIDIPVTSDACTIRCLLRWTRIVINSKTGVPCTMLFVPCTTSTFLGFTCAQCSFFYSIYHFGSVQIFILEALTFVPHTCYIGEKLCQPTYDCTEYIRLRKCCCNQFVLKKCKCASIVRFCKY